MKSVFNTLFKDLSKESIFYSEINFGIVSSIDADCLQFEIAEENLPKKIKYLNSEGIELSFKLSYSAITDDEDLTKNILFVVEDVTELEYFEKMNKEKTNKTLKNKKVAGNSF